MMRPEFTKNDGFTLLDVLVALAVTGLAGSILVGLVTFINRSTTRIHAEANAVTRLAAVRLVLASLSREAYSPAPNAPDTSRPHGTNTRFSVRARGPAILGLGQAAEFSVVYRPAASGSQLSLEWRDPDTDKFYRELLISDLESAEFAYFGAIRGASVRTWHPAWRPDGQSPEAVRVSIRARTFPTPVDIILPLRATLPSACLRNPRHPGCLPS